MECVQVNGKGWDSQCYVRAIVMGKKETARSAINRKPSVTNEPNQGYQRYTIK